MPIEFGPASWQCPLSLHPSEHGIGVEQSSPMNPGAQKHQRAREQTEKALRYAQGCEDAVVEGERRQADYDKRVAEVKAAKRKRWKAREQQREVDAGERRIAKAEAEAAQKKMEAKAEASERIAMQREDLLRPSTGTAERIGGTVVQLAEELLQLVRDAKVLVSVDVWIEAPG